MSSFIAVMHCCLPQSSSANTETDTVRSEPARRPKPISNIHSTLTCNRLIAMFRITSRRSSAAILTIVLTCVAVSACGTDEDVGRASDPTTQIDRGQSIFAQNCAVCHGANGEGQPNWNRTKDDGTLPAPPLNGDGHTWHHADGTLYKQVRYGGAYLESQGLPAFKSGMPAFEDTLTHREIIDVLTYVKSLWTDRNYLGRNISDSQSEASKNDPFPIN